MSKCRYCGKEFSLKIIGLHENFCKDQKKDNEDEIEENVDITDDEDDVDEIDEVDYSQWGMKRLRAKAKELKISYGGKNKEQLIAAIEEVI